MGNLTIDQILAERKGEDSPQTFGYEKEASAQPQSSRYSDDEIEKMAGLLKEAHLPEASSNNEGSDNFNERLAAALILQESIQALTKEAQEEAEAESGKKSKKKEEDKDEDDEDEETQKSASDKLASFVKAAQEAGHSEEEIKGFLEKKALKMPSWKQVAKGLGLGAAGAGSAYAGKEYGEEQTARKAEKALKTVLPRVFQAGKAQGVQQGARRGFRAGAYASNNAWKRNLKQRAQKNKGK